jgi:MOSC domain-containing protein YiiM
MFQGQLVGIFLHGRKGTDLHPVEQVEAVAGHGLAGDRYFRNDGCGKPDQEVTLIESESLEALPRDCGLTLLPHQPRRNLLTRGVPLNHLVGREFTVGEVLLRGLRLCEPCDHLEMLTAAGVKNHLIHRGGLRAEILRGGVLHPGDSIRPCPAETASAAKK